MLRDTEFVYGRGPGYQKHEDGSVTELYWERVGKSAKKLVPYSVTVVGVSASAEVAVQRGDVKTLE